eukprot:c789_g1_i1.p1 GENE.c789_g1_i1~~c789_g1_i1.p1  ORF type:complete len:474 (+),score=85.60 c789_g1_i1:34-1422(+)
MDQLECSAVYVDVRNRLFPIGNAIENNTRREEYWVEDMLAILQRAIDDERVARTHEIEAERRAEADRRADTERAEAQRRADTEREEEERRAEAEREKEEETRRQAVLRIAQEAEQTQPRTPLRSPSHAPTTQNTGKPEMTIREGKIGRSKAWELYDRIMAEKTRIAQSAKIFEEKFEKDQQIKDEVRKMKRTIRTTSNQISTTPEQLFVLIEKFNVELTKAARLQEKCFNYSIELLSVAIVDQASDGQIRSHPPSALAYAAVCSSVWNRHPKLLFALLGELFSRCLWCVPLLPCKKTASGQKISDEEHLTTAGYQRSGDGQWELELAYFERMRSMLMFFSALLLIPGNSGVNQTLTGRPSEGLEGAWQWLACVMNMKQSRAAGVMLSTFMPVCTHSLVSQYPNQTRKILELLRTEYMSELRSKQKSGQTFVNQLQLFLETDGHKQPPEGLDVLWAVLRHKFH